MTAKTPLSLKQRMINRLRKIRWHCEAALALAVARFLVQFLPYRSWRWTLGAIEPSKQEFPDYNERDEAIAIIAGKYVRRTARRLPFEAVCLPKAMAGFWMLKRRGIQSRIVFGAGESPDTVGTAYHAWLLYRDTYVTGLDTQGTFTPLAKGTSNSA